MIRTCRFGTGERDDATSVAGRRGPFDELGMVSTGLANSAASRLVVRSGAEGFVGRVAGRGIDSSSGEETMAKEGK